MAVKLLLCFKIEQITQKTGIIEIYFGHFC